MDKNKLRLLLEKVKEGKTGIDEALSALKALPFEDLGFAMVDNHRSLRKGFPEVIFCEGKSLEQVNAIASKLLTNHEFIIATRAGRDVYETLRTMRDDIRYHERARFIQAGAMPEKKTDRTVLVVTAGTSDIPVAEEAALTVESMGAPVERLFDVGVAGIHRLFSNIHSIHSAGVIIAVAGMDGALPSIIGGIAERPVIAVPTSIGYGASFHGLAALLTMLNSCAPGVVVVNIDNGFGAGYAASMIVLGDGNENSDL